MQLSIAAAIVISMVALALPVAAQPQAEPLLGTWHLNFVESTFASPPAYKRLVCKIEPWKDGVKVTYDMVGVRGGVTHWEWTGRIDGKDYPVQGVEEAMTNAYTRTGDSTYTVIAKLDGRTTTITRIQISPDGQVMTATNPSSNATGSPPLNTAIYQKQ